MILADMIPNEFVSLVAPLTSVGFAIWYGWFVTTRTIPKLVEDFRAELQSERKTFAEALDKIADRFVCTNDKS